MHTRMCFPALVMLSVALFVPASQLPGEESKALPGPVSGTRITEAYVQQVARSAHAWAWPMMNIRSRFVAYSPLPGPGLAGGVLPVAPPNHLCMLHGYIEPTERAVACPNQDVVYGQCITDFSKEPVVVQVPDFGDRFWVYQVVDQRTDSFAGLGKMYDTKPGFYLLVGADWKGKVPVGITATFRCPTRHGALFPRACFRATSRKTKRLFRRCCLRSTPTR